MRQHSDRSSIFPQGKSFDFFDHGEYPKRSQYLSMNAFAVDREYRNKNGKLIKTCLKRRPVNRILNGNKNFDNQEDVLDLLIKDYTQADLKTNRVKEMTILNNFYKKSQEVSTPNGAIKSNAYCKLPKIEFKIQQALPKIFINDALEYRFKQQQMVARSFVNKGYGFNQFLSQVAQHPNGVKIKAEQYRNLLGTVITEALRKAQTFAMEQCCMDIRKVNRAQLKLLLIILLNCRTHLSSQDCQTFFQYIKMCFYIGDVFITAQASVRLMSSIQQALKRRIFEKTGEKATDEAHRTGNELLWTSKGGYTNEKLQLHRIWNGQLQRMLISVYKKQQDMNKITRHFRKTYPKKQNFFTTEALKTRLHRTLREGIKKVQFLKQVSGANSSIPQMNRISKHSFNGILNGRSYYKIRVMLLEMYQNDDCSQYMVSNAIEMLNDVSSSNWRSNRRLSKNKQRINEAEGYQQELELQIEQLMLLQDQ